jgi:uncharacterized protein (DUF1810 family)
MSMPTEADDKSLTTSAGTKNNSKVSALQYIVDAQEGTLSVGGDAGSATFDCPPFSTALEEIDRGEKRSCWMWYIWPSLRGVRVHRMPHLLLSDLAEAQTYLRHDVLGPRLVEITAAAVHQLHSGVPKGVLFDGNLDSTKFHETCSIFAVAAVLCNDMESAALFATALVFYGCLNPQAIGAIRDQDPDTENALINSCIRTVMDLARQAESVESHVRRSTAPME